MDEKPMRRLRVPSEDEEWAREIPLPREDREINVSDSDAGGDMAIGAAGDGS